MKKVSELSVSSEFKSDFWFLCGCNFDLLLSFQNI
jgi:hypothetical protein